MWRQQVSPPYVYHLKVASANLLTNLMRVSKSWEAVPSHGFDQRSCFSTMLSWRQQNSCPAAHHSVSVAAHLCHSFCHSTPALLFLLQHVSAILSVTGHQRCSFCYSTLVLLFLSQYTSVALLHHASVVLSAMHTNLVFLLHHTTVVLSVPAYHCSFCYITLLLFFL